MLANKDDFNILYKSNRIVCFGRGEGFLAFSRMMNSLGLDDRIAYIVDNDDTIYGTVVPGYDKSWTVYSPKRIINEKSCLVVITLMSLSLCEQIKKQTETELGVEEKSIVFSMPIFEKWLKEKKKKFCLQKPFKISAEPIIPPVIHYCWFGNNPIPKQYEKWMMSWREFCPNYEIVRWDESNYDVNKTNYTREAYKAGKWAFVSDYARLDIIFNHGGIYLDTDVEIIKPLDIFLYEEGFAGYLTDERINTGLGFGARKGLPIIKELMEDYNTKEFIDVKNRKEKICIQMCSEIQTEHLLRNKDWKYTNDIVDMDGLRVYPSPVFDGLNADKCTREKISYTIHHYTGSWLND